MGRHVKVKGGGIVQILKIIALQALWFLIVLYGKDYSPLIGVLGAGVFVLLDLLFYRPKAGIRNYLSRLLFFICFGALHDFLLLKMNIVKTGSYSLNFLLLWVVFIGYYDEIFNKMRKLPLLVKVLFGGIGGALAYNAAIRLGALEASDNNFWALMTFTFISGSFFFPFSLWLYDMKSFKDKILDALVVTSFDSSGYKRHSQDFKEIAPAAGKKVLVTGGTGGIGRSVVEQLLNLKCSVHFMGRNKEKGEQYAQKGGHFHQLDMAAWSQIQSTCDEFDEAFDYVVLNAGGMPEELTLNEKGVEMQCASQLIGHYRLIKTLKDKGLLKPAARIVFVSSGGMYLRKLDLKELLKPDDYDKVATYANVKRAQVTFVEEIVKDEEWKDYNLFSMHPGWVDTGGLKEALPGFYKLFGNRLRNAQQGADTIVWLLLTPKDPERGGFFFDREKVSPVIHSTFSPDARQREDLMKLVKSYSL